MCVLSPLVELNRVQKELEVELARHAQDVENLKQTMSQMERDSQLALKKEEQVHEEDVERLIREKVKKKK